MFVDFNAITLPEPSARERVLETASRPEPAQLSSEGTASAQINEGALLSFDSALSKQMVDDVSNSLLFAQLAADKQFSRLAATADWERTFFNTLSIVGWAAGSFTNSSIVAASPVDWIKLIAPYMPENVDHLVASSITSCQLLPVTSKAVTIWMGAALERDEGVAIIGPSYPVNGSVNASILILKFIFQRDASGFLKWNSDYNIDLSSVNIELNESVYSNVRKTIISKLGNRPQYLVANVPME